MPLPKPPARIPRGRIVFHGQDLLQASERDLRAIRGNRISMIFQDPMSSLNPFLRISQQLVEVLEIHKGMTGAEADARAIEMLGMVGIPAAGRLRIWIRRGHGHLSFRGGTEMQIAALAPRCHRRLGAERKSPPGRREKVAAWGQQRTRRLGPLTNPGV